MRNKIIVQKMLRMIDTIGSYCKGVSYTDFINNSMLIEACVFNLSQIGEISSKVDRAFEEEHPEIPWRQIYGLRNRIVHDYEGVNKQLVWEIISDDLPALRGKLEKITGAFS